MSKKWYGSLTNRLNENCYFNGTFNNLKIGTPCTEYLYSDRIPYEVVKVDNQKHIWIRELDAERIDDNGMSDCQSYGYKSNINNPIKELELTKFGWKEVIRYNKELYEKLIKKQGYVLWGDEIVNKVLNNKEVKRSSKINISFGIAQYYYDYSI